MEYHGNLYILIPLNQRLALTSLWATGPAGLELWASELQVQRSQPLGHATLIVISIKSASGFQATNLIVLPYIFLGSASEEEEKEEEEEEEEEKPAAANTHPPLRRADSEELLREQFNKGKI